MMEDLHICGVCKSFFSDIKEFTEHKLCCVVSQNAQTTSSSSTEDILDKETICSERALDLAILESGTFPFVLQCDNEEVISETTQLDIDEPTNKAELENIINTNNIINKIDEEDVAALLVNELPKEVIKHYPNGPVSKINKSKSQKQSLQKHCNLERVEKGSKAANQSIKKESRNKRKVTSVKSKQKNVVCNLCDFESIFPKDLVRHMRVHTGERPFKCLVCDKRFARQDKLTEHKRIHFADKRYKCQLCEYACTSSSALRKHEQTHTDERPHRCQICLYKARSSSHLVIHLRTHTGDSPFFCIVENCSYVFKTSSDLKRHIKNHKHKFHSDPETTDKVSCKSCLEEKKTLNRHLFCPGCQNVKLNGSRCGRGKKRRPGSRVRCEKVHKCPHCQAAFVREDSLRSHERSHPQSQMTPPASPVEEQEEVVEEGNRSPDLFGSTEANEGTLTHLYAEGADSCLEISYIPLEQDIIVQSIMDTSFL